MFDQYEEDHFEFVYDLSEGYADAERKWGGSKSDRVRNVNRDRAAGAVQLHLDYLAEIPTYSDIHKVLYGSYSINDHQRRIP